MSENHLSNLIEKLAELEGQLEEARKDRDNAKYEVVELIKKNSLMRDIECKQEAVDHHSARVEYYNNCILSLRRRIKRAS